MDAATKGKPARGALALLVALGTIAAGAILQPNPRAVQLDATVERVAADLRAVNALLSPEALAERVARLRPLVEEELGAPIPGPIEVVPVGHEAWIDARVARSGHALVPTSAAAVRAWMVAAAEATWQAMLTPADYDPEGDRIELLGHHVVDEPGDDARAVLLDLVVSHELVHVWHHRLHADAPLFAVGDDPEGAAAAAAAEEGHAQVVARRVAERLGIADRFDRIVPRLDSPELERIPPGDRAEAERRLAPAAFRYRVGERYVDALVGRYGMAEATRRVLDEPPRSVWEVCRPGEPPAPRAEAVASLEKLAQWTALALGPDEPAIEPVVPGELWLNLGDDADPDAAVAHVRRAVRFASGDRAVRLVLLDDARAAAHFAEAWERTALTGERPLDVIDVAVRGEPGTRRVVVTGRGDDGLPRSVLRGLAARGPFFVEVTAARDAPDEEAFVREFERVAAMAGDSPLRDVADAEPVVARLADADPDVALVTLHGLMRAGRLDEVPPDLRRRESLLPAALEAWPDDPDLARAALGSAAAAVRRAAIVHTARLESRPDWAAAALLDALGDHDAQVRVAALGGLEEGGVDPARVRALLDDPEPRIRARAPGLLPEGARRAAARDATRDVSPGVRAAGWAWLLGAAGDGDADGSEFPDPNLLEQALDDPSPAVRLRIAGALPALVAKEMPRRITGRGPRLEYAGLVRRVLRDDDVRVRLVALSALMMASVGGPVREAVEALYRFRDRREMQMFAPLVLGNLVGRDPRATDLLTGLLTDGWCQPMAARALAPDSFDTPTVDRRRSADGRFDMPPARVPALLPVFRALAEHWDPDVRLRGVAGLHDLGESLPPGAREQAVADALAGGAAQQRPDAAAFAVSLGAVGVRLVVDRLREETDPRCLGRFLSVLGSARSDQGRPSAEELVSLALEVLDRHGDAARYACVDWAESWVSWRRWDPEDVPEAALQRLAERIQPLLADPTPWVRSAAAGFASVLPQRWREEADRLLADRARVEDDVDVFERLADWRNFGARDEEHMPAGLREALEARRHDPDRKIARLAAAALDADPAD